MSLSQRQKILLETTTAREKAEALLRRLLESKAQSERHLAELKQPDTFKAVTGRSAMDNAIASTRRIIETLDRAVQQIKKDLTEEDLAAIDEMLPGEDNK